MPESLVPVDLLHTSPLPAHRPLVVVEVAEYLHMCPATVRREAHRGHLRGYKVAGQRWRFHAADVEDYLNGVGR